MVSLPLKAFYGTEKPREAERQRFYAACRRQFKDCPLTPSKKRRTKRKGQNQVEEFTSQPGYVGLESLRGEWRSVAEPDPKVGGKNRVRRAINAHPLDWFNDKGRLSVGQYQAGERYYKAYCVWSGQMGMAIDMESPKVDTSSRGQGLLPNQIDAADIIREATKELGHTRAYRFQLITGEGWFPKDIARNLDGRTSGRAIQEATEYWLSSLHLVAQVYGFASNRLDKRNS